MANATPTRLGQNLATGDANALFLKIFSGEVLSAFGRENQMMNMTSVRNIQSGKSSSSAFFLHSFFNSSKFFVPYCDCSLSPNRLRFGPLIIIILLFIQHLYTMKKIKKIKIKINGKIKSINQDSTLSAVLKNLKIPLNKVAIELNEEIIDKKKINKIKLNNNDKVEIVHFIGGG